MNFWKRLDGMVTVTMTAAVPEESLQAINERGIRLDQVRWLEPLTVQFRCSRKDRRAVEAICKKRGDETRFSAETGVKPLLQKVLARPFLLVGCGVLLLLTAYLPTRVFFFQVEGNKTVPSRMILEAAADCGIRFGVSRREIRSEKMKNALLEAMPELKWAGINTAGCTATICVRERAMEEVNQTMTSRVSSIAAVRDAYITDLTVTRGTALCAPGQVVGAGQILISGHTDLGICVQVTRAQGEVFGETIHEFRAVTPAQWVIRQEATDSVRRYSLILGKKRINFGKGSGISPATCGRMYKEYYMTLPGGFQLPLGLAVETTIPWKTGRTTLAPKEETMRAFARHQLLAETVAGTILAEDLSFSREKDVFCLQGWFSCSEMIGREVTEEIGEANGKTD